MCTARVLVLVAAFVALAGIGLAATPNTAQTQTQGQDQWRYTYFNSQWWYWLPEGRWVYWQDNRWNDFHPQPVTSSSSSGDRAASGYGNQAVTDSDVRPFYGHSLSNSDRRPLEANEEAGPFYGRAMPSEVFGPWRGAGPSGRSTVTLLRTPANERRKSRS